MKVLVACEFSGIVRDAFKRRGHDAVSCDIIASEQPGKHRQEDVRNLLNEKWDLIIAHPPCTYLAVSGARWFSGRLDLQDQALGFFSRFLACDTKVCVENPISVASRFIRKPDQIIQPWQFGHPETKATCLWLKGLPKLVPTKIVKGREARVHREPPGPDRWKNRSRTYTGIAEAMAEQWGGTTTPKDERVG